MEQPDLNYLKTVIRSILTSSPGKVTISQILNEYSDFEGCTLSYKHLGFNTIFELLENMNDVLKIPSNPNMNSFITLIVNKKTSHLRELVVNQKIKSRPKRNTSSIRSANYRLPKPENEELLSKKDDKEYNIDSTIDNSCPSQSEKSIVSYEIYDSKTISDTMKVKLRNILSKHKDGISCNHFMNVYSKEYNSDLNFFKYGFSSMRDMAYKLPSVFYVKASGYDHECILFEANRRSELEINLDDPSLYYKNIPKTILYNLSTFFDKYRAGIKFDELMTLYCTEHGRAYEPLKYGYSSEKHMFECLDKMVEIKNNMLFTLNPFAYIKVLEFKDHTVHCDKNSDFLLDPNFLLYYSGNDICNGRFKYPKIKLNNKKYKKVIVSEIYNPSSFYIQLATEVDNLIALMDSLQVYYNDNEEKYIVLPKLILPELPCASCFSDTKLWHRAKVLKIVDEDNVELYYVDYGTIEIVPKTNIRLLASQFGAYPTQAVHCGLYEYNELSYPREISESFAAMVDFHELQAQFHKPKSEDDSQKMTVTLFLITKNNKININEKFSKEIINHLNKNQESVRRMIYKVMEKN